MTMTVRATELQEQVMQPALLVGCKEMSSEECTPAGCPKRRLPQEGDKTYSQYCSAGSVPHLYTKLTKANPLFSPVSLS